MDLTGDGDKGKPPSLPAAVAAGPSPASMTDLHAPLAVDICSDIWEVEETVLPDLPGLADVIQTQKPLELGQTKAIVQHSKFRPKKPKSREVSAASAGNHSIDVGGNVCSHTATVSLASRPKPAPSSSGSMDIDSPSARQIKKRKRGRSKVNENRDLARSSAGAKANAVHDKLQSESEPWRSSAAGIPGNDRDIQGRGLGSTTFPHCPGRGGREPSSHRRRNDHRDSGSNSSSLPRRFPPQSSYRAPVYERSEHELNLRMQQLEKLSAAQAKIQGEMDTKSVQLEARERELDAREKRIGISRHSACDEALHNDYKKEMQLLQEKSAALAKNQLAFDRQRVELEKRKKDVERNYSDCERNITSKKEEFDLLLKKKEQEISQLRKTNESEMARLRKDNERAMEERRNENERDLQRLRAEAEQDTELQKKCAREACSHLEKQAESLRHSLETLRQEYNREKDIQRREMDVAKQEFQLAMEAERNAVAALRTELARERDTAWAAIELRSQELVHSAQMQERQQIYLNSEAADQKLSAESFLAEKTKAEESIRLKESLLETRARSQEKQKAELIRLHEELEERKVKQQKEFKDWAVARAKQQEEMEEWIGHEKAQIANRRSELDARAASLLRQQQRAKNLITTLRASGRKQSQDEVDPAKPVPRETKAPSISQMGSGLHAEKGATEAKNDSATELDSKLNLPKVENIRQSGGCDFVLVDSDSDEDNVECPEPEFGKQYRFDYHQNFNYMHSAESASEIQDRLFRQAAEKMKAQPSVRVASGDAPKAFQFSSPVFNISERYPNHWKWRDPHSVLGLPPDAPQKLVKSQFRRLARAYHPDKSNASDSGAKFHSISAAYHKIVQHE